MMRTGITVVMLVLALSVGSFVNADVSGVLEKITAAGKAAEAKDGAAVVAALGDAATMIAADAEGAGDAGTTLAMANKAELDDLAARAGKGQMPPAMALNAAKARVSDLYGAFIPASKGNTAAAAAYVNKMAAEATGDVQAKLKAAAAGIGGAMGAEMMRVTLGSTVLLHKAEAAIKDDPKLAARMLQSAALYVKAESEIQRAAGAVAKADELRELSGQLNVTARDIVQGVSDEFGIVSDMAPRIEQVAMGVVEAEKPAAPMEPLSEAEKEARKEARKPVE